MTKNNDRKDCLIEIGMEELPPKAMPGLAKAFGKLIVGGLAVARLTHDDHRVFAAPRRLAILINNLDQQQPDEEIVMRGPPVRIAFDDNGEPTKAALAFASKAGTTVDALQRETTDKGEWLVHHTVQAGVSSSELLGDIVRTALDGLPIPRRMRWGVGENAFIRPLHWLTILHGDDVPPVTIFDIKAGRETQGHRFHHPGNILIKQAADYPDVLRKAYVIADFKERRDKVWAIACDAAAKVGGQVNTDDALIDEIAALCDWPVAVVGDFDPRFLTLPVEVLESTLKIHQRYFPVVDADGKAMAHFVTIANIESQSPMEVQRGNERVVTPRLADAEFFWLNDSKRSLDSRRARLSGVVYQKALGSLADKSARVAKLCAAMVESLDVDGAAVLRAAELARCDLVTDMVGEFPDLQGVMGGYYAQNDGEDSDVVSAIREQYFPRFAGDAIPGNLSGQILGAAERIDTLAGIFAIGKRPSGNRDPFGLRRAALGLLRISIEAPLDVDFRALIVSAVEAQPIDTSKHPELADDIYDYVTERLRHYYDQSICIERGDLFDAVLAREPRSMVDFDARLKAVAHFVTLPEASALAAANKRIGNMLRGGGVDAYAELDENALTEPAERALYRFWHDARQAIAPLLVSRDYTGVLTRLSSMRGTVDQFFDDVMVMADDVDVRRNRMALLTEVRGLFLEVADISELGGAGGG